MAGQALDYLFHYTSEDAARSIIDDESDGFGLYFTVGTGNWHGHGYATDIGPVDATSMDNVNAYCFGGGATYAELNYVLTLMALQRRAPLRADRQPIRVDHLRAASTGCHPPRDSADGDPALRRCRLDGRLVQRRLRARDKWLIPR